MPRRGFSLMELIISVGIIATAILLVVGIFTFLFKASQKSVDLTAGTVVAESIMQNTVTRFIYDSSFRSSVMQNHSGYNNTELEQGTKSYNGAQFSYSIYATDLSQLGSSATNPMLSLSVICRWWDSGGGLAGSARSGYGQLAVELNRIVVYSADF
jgi:prepilin-type N-terminal cleavage/methylation domain-containing protein